MVGPLEPKRSYVLVHPVRIVPDVFLPIHFLPFGPF